MEYILHLVPDGDLHDCMVPRVVSTCRKPAYTFFAGAKGPFYFCRKCTRIELRQRPNFKIGD